MKDYWEDTQKITADYMGLSLEEVKPESTWEELGLDSLDHVELVMEFEETYDIECADEDVERLQTVGAWAAYLAERLNPKG
jgi:acyl carrier protein